jgi:hypothetical protein
LGQKQLYNVMKPEEQANHDNPVRALPLSKKKLDSVAF